MRHNSTLCFHKCFSFFYLALALTLFHLCANVSPFWLFPVALNSFIKNLQRRIHVHFERKEQHQQCLRMHSVYRAKMHVENPKWINEEDSTRVWVNKREWLCERKRKRNERTELLAIFVFYFLHGRQPKIEITASFALFSFFITFFLSHFPFINSEEQNNLSFFMFMERLFFGLLVFMHSQTEEKKHCKWTVSIVSYQYEVLFCLFPFFTFRLIVKCRLSFSHIRISLWHFNALVVSIRYGVKRRFTLINDNVMRS